MPINNVLPHNIGGEILSTPLNDNFATLLANDMSLQIQVESNDADIANRYTKSEVNALDANLQSQIDNDKTDLANHLSSSTAHGSNSIINQSSVIGTKVSDALTTVQQQVNALVVGGTTNTTIGVYSLTTTGGANAYIGTFSGLTYFGGLKINATINVTNTGSSTFNLNGLGVKNIKKMSASGSKLDLTGGDLKLNNKVQLEYDGTDFILLQEGKSETFYTLEMTPTTSIQSVTDSVDGIVDVSIGGATLENTIVNGGFLNGTAGWTQLSVTGFAVVDEIGKFTATAVNGRIIAPKPKRKNGTTYALIARFKSNSNQVGLSSEGARVPGLSHSGSGLFETKVGLFVAPSDIAQWSLAIQDDRPSGWTEVEVDYIMTTPLTGTAYESETNPAKIAGMIKEYWEGVKSTELVTVESVGRNLFDGYTPYQYGQYATFDGNELKATANRTYILGTRFRFKVKKNTNYKLKFNKKELGGGANAFYVSTFNGNLTQLTVTNNNTLGNYEVTANPGDTDYLIVEFARTGGSNDTIGYAVYDQIMLVEGTTALPYEPNENSILTVNCTDNTKFDMPLLPNLKDNEVNQSKGYISAVKRVARHVVQSADITALNTALVNVDVIAVSRKSDSLAGTPNVDGATIISGFNKEVSNANIDLTSSVYCFYSGSNYSLIVPKGTYANLAAAQTALAGTVIYYELATPTFIPYEDFADYGIEVDGVIGSSKGYTQFSYSGDLLPSVDLTYPMDLGASILSMKDALVDVIDTARDINLTLNRDWQIYSPTLSWGGTPPSSLSIVAKYKQVGAIVYFAVSISSLDGNGAIGVTITLPVTPVLNGFTIPINSQQRVGSNWYNPLAYVTDDTNFVRFHSFQTASDGAPFELHVNGFYEVV